MPEIHGWQHVRDEMRRGQANHHPRASALSGFSTSQGASLLPVVPRSEDEGQAIRNPSSLSDLSPKNQVLHGRHLPRSTGVGGRSTGNSLEWGLRRDAARGIQLYSWWKKLGMSEEPRRAFRQLEDAAWGGVRLGEPSDRIARFPDNGPVRKAFGDRAGRKHDPFRAHLNPPTSRAQGGSAPSCVWPSSYSRHECLRSPRISADVERRRCMVTLRSRFRGRRCRDP